MGTASSSESWSEKMCLFQNFFLSHILSDANQKLGFPQCWGFPSLFPKLPHFFLTMWLLTNSVDSSNFRSHLHLPAAAKICYLPTLVFLTSKSSKIAFVFLLHFFLTPVSMVAVGFPWWPKWNSKENPLRIKTKKVATLRDLRIHLRGTPGSDVSYSNSY